MAHNGGRPDGPIPPLAGLRQRQGGAAVHTHHEQADGCGRPAFGGCPGQRGRSGDAESPDHYAPARHAVRSPADPPAEDGTYDSTRCPAQGHEQIGQCHGHRKQQTDSSAGSSADDDRGGAVTAAQGVVRERIIHPRAPPLV